MHRTALLALTFGLTAAAQHVWRPIVMGKHGMVAAEHPLQALAGARVLESGGNAFGAAAAVFYTTAVVEQHQSGLGGSAFVLAYVAKLNRVAFLNGNCFAPKLATAEYFRKLGKIPADGPLASEVPGAVAAFDVLVKTYGSRNTGQLLDTAIDAAEGHPLTLFNARQAAEAVSFLSRFPLTASVFLKGGGPPEPGDMLVQRDLARTLRAIAAQGPEIFYRGELARSIDQFERSNGGLIRLEDLNDFQPEAAEPLKVAYKGYDVYGCPPNSQGIVMLMALKLLEGYDLKALGHNSAEYLDVITEALKLAFADRDRYIADPRFVKDIPVAALLSEDYARVRRSLIRTDRAMEGVPPAGDPRHFRATAAGPPAVRRRGLAAEGDTSSFSIADRFGNVVSATHSVNGNFGNGMLVEGFLMNNRLPYFSLDEKDVNRLEPRKRTRHTITPALALRNGKPVLAWNTPGGDNQPQAMLQAFLNVVEFGMNLQQALESPSATTNMFQASMFPHPVGDRLTLPRVLAERAAAALKAKGHRVEAAPMQQPYFAQPSGVGAVKMIRIDPATGLLMGGVSPAKDDYVIGW
ncbi:MAG: gamma-glutamyltransferase family protein [Bryobacteraceae bacterium]